MGFPSFRAKGNISPLIQPGFVTFRLWTEQLQLIRMAFFRQCQVAILMILFFFEIYLR